MLLSENLVKLLFVLTWGYTVLNMVWAIFHMVNNPVDKSDKHSLITGGYHMGKFWTSFIYSVFLSLIYAFGV